MTESTSFLSALGLAQSKFRGNATVIERCQALYHMLKLA
jgi:hypothetical protein